MLNHGFYDVRPKKLCWTSCFNEPQKTKDPQKWSRDKATKFQDTKPCSWKSVLGNWCNLINLTFTQENLHPTLEVRFLKCYLLSVFKTRNPYPPQPFFFTSPFFGGENNPVGCHHQVQRLSSNATAFFSTSSSALVFDTSTFATRSFHLG